MYNFSAGGIISVAKIPFIIFLRFLQNTEKISQLRDMILTTTIFGTQPQNTRKKSLLLLVENIYTKPNHDIKFTFEHFCCGCSSEEDSKKNQNLSK